MANLDWSKFTVFDHLIACAMLAMICVIPLAAAGLLSSVVRSIVGLLGNRHD